MKKPTLPIDFSKSLEAAAIVRAITHPLRLEIMQYIDRQKQTKVGPIYQDMQIDQSICSQHLKILRDHNIVFVRQGKTKNYALNYDRISHIYSIVSSLKPSEQ